MDEETYAFETRETTDDQSGLSIHAGFPNPGAEARSLSLDFNQLLVSHGAGTFVFRVRGQDWRRYGVWDNDLAVVDRLLAGRPGDLIVWCRPGDSGFGISPIKKIPVDATTWGVVTAIIHEFRAVQRASHE